MREVQIRQYHLRYDDDQIDGYFDANNERLAFNAKSDLLLVVDVNNDQLTFHPNGGDYVSIEEIDDTHYELKSDF
ncbi:hypothetical protein AKUH3B111A_14300 [Apilactobacillus kunkeei]|nr:hypothetical protein AKUH3B103M_14370 [Apilactobacillus kunkeei]CAI2667967.1 hypothetical protein AKUH3B111A_14300 [Apilactobacillus kunkeei]CAI2667990.1 hypothetical protein AKUH3B104X_14370 [Apilactobacillus kunkeei]CAI2697339.1 hypothetical protein AKUA1404_14430 [Apilactobacillus kunkeei]